MRKKKEKSKKPSKKNTKIRMNRSYLIIMEVVLLLVIVSLAVFFSYFIKKEMNAIRRESEHVVLQNTGNQGTSMEVGNKISPLVMAQLRKEGIGRYFLTKVKLINNSYIPLVNLCLFQNGQPIYPLYIYETWSLVNYPDSLNPQKALVKFLLLPKDNKNFQLDKSCFLKEIKTDADWIEMENKYNFSQKQF